MNANSRTNSTSSLKSKQGYRPLKMADMDGGGGYEDEELVAPGPDERNWRGIGIALLVIIAIISLIVMAIVLLTPGDKGPRVKNERFNLNEILTGEYAPRTFNGTWVSESEFLYRDTEGHLMLYNANNRTRSEQLQNMIFSQYVVAKYTISPDRRFLLFETEIKKIFRHSYYAKYITYEIKTDKPLELDPMGAPGDYLLYASWGPEKNQLVYVYKNDIYYVPSVGESHIRLTTTGVEGIIYNGIPDWVYEEEVFSRNNVIWWSPDGTKLSYASFNDNNVSIMTYPRYGPYKQPEDVYPTQVQIRYPKPGKTNPEVSLWVVDLTNLSTGNAVKPMPVSPPKEVADREHYLISASWMDANNLFAIWLRRTQNFSVVSHCSAQNKWNCEKHLVEETGTRGWIDLYGPPLFAADKHHYFLRLPVQDGKFGHYKHVSMIRVNDSKKDFLTHGQYDITEILTHDEETNSVYFLSTLKGKPGEQHLFSVTDMESESSRELTCLTCNISAECLYNNAIISPNSKFYILECLGPGIPWVELRSLPDNQIVDILDLNEDLHEKVDKRAIPQIRTFTVPVADNFNAHVRLFLPPGLREDEITQYPMVVNVYAGPGSQLITERFAMNWGSYLASKKDIIYAYIDGRGSGNEGEKKLHTLNNKLGTVEVEDQIAVSKYLKEDLPFIDSERIAIWGWSYGGYVTAMALATSTDVFSCGVSVAPVTSWIYYDSIYTERYMSMPTPQDNYLNYEKSDVLKKAKDMMGKKFLLIHGTADDNVHLQQSMMFMKALTDEKVLFQTQIYPDENHSLQNVKPHLYRTMESFLDKCFGIAEGESAVKDAPKSR